MTEHAIRNILDVDGLRGKSSAWLRSSPHLPFVGKVWGTRAACSFHWVRALPKYDLLTCWMAESLVRQDAYEFHLEELAILRVGVKDDPGFRSKDVFRYSHCTRSRPMLSNWTASRHVQILNAVSPNAPLLVEVMLCSGIRMVEGRSAGAASEDAGWFDVFITRKCKSSGSIPFLRLALCCLDVTDYFEMQDTDIAPNLLQKVFVPKSSSPRYLRVSSVPCF